MPNDLIRRLAEMQAAQGSDGSQLMMDSIRDDMGLPSEDMSNQPLPLPNGGLVGEDLDNHIRKNTGPVATTGYNPSADTSPLRGQISKATQTNLGNQDPSTPAVRELATTGTGAVNRVLPPVQSNPSETLGYGRDLNDSALADAQKNSSLLRLIGGLGNASSTIGAAASRGDLPAKQIGDDLIKNADQGVKDISVRREAKDKELSREKNLLELSTEKQRSDPNSDISKFGQAIAKKLSAATGIPLNNLETSSWSALKEAIPGLERYAAQMENTKFRQEMAEQRKSSKQTDTNEKQFIKLGEALDVNRARAGATGKVADKLNSAERVEGLFKQFPDGNIPKVQTRELATSVAALLSSGGSGAAVSQINELVPHTLAGNAAGIAEWVTNSPTGLGQQKFMKMLAETAQREKEIALNQLKRDRLAKIPAFEHLQKADPDRFNSILKGTGQIDPEEYARYKKGDRIDVTGGLNKFSGNKSTTSNEDSRVDAFMQANGIKDRDEAIKILKENGKL